MNCNFNRHGAEAARGAHNSEVTRSKRVAGSLLTVVFHFSFFIILFILFGLLFFILCIVIIRCVKSNSATTVAHRNRIWNTPRTIFIKRAFFIKRITEYHWATLPVIRGWKLPSRTGVRRDSIDIAS